MVSEETTTIYLEAKNNDISGIVTSSITIQEQIDETNICKEKNVISQEQCNDEIDCADSEISKPLKNEADMNEVNTPQNTSTARVDAHGSSDDYDAVTDNGNVPWPDINIDEGPYPSNKSICGVKEETNIPHEQQSPKNERTKNKPLIFRTPPHHNAYSDGEYEEEEEDDAEISKRSHNQSSVGTDRRMYGAVKVLEVHDDSYIRPVKKRSIRYNRKKLNPNYDRTDVLSDGEYDETPYVDLMYSQSTSDKMKKYRNNDEIQKSGTLPLETASLEHTQKSPGAQFIEADQYSSSQQIHNHRSQHTESRKPYFQHDQRLKTEKETLSDEDQKHHYSQHQIGSTQYEVHRERSYLRFAQDEFLHSDRTHSNESNAKLPSHSIKNMSNNREDKSYEEYRRDAVLYNGRVESSFYDDKQHVTYQQTPNRKVSEHKKEWKKTPHNQDLKGRYPPTNESFGNKKNPSLTSTMSRHHEGAMPFQYVHDTSYDDHSTFEGLTQYEHDQSRQSVPMDYEASPLHHYQNTKKHQANRRYYDDKDVYIDEEYEYPYMQRNCEPQEDIQQNRRGRPHPYPEYIDVADANNPRYHAQERFNNPAVSSTRVEKRVPQQRGNYYRENINHVRLPNYDNSYDGQFGHSHAAYSEVTHPYSHKVSNHDHDKYTERSYNSHTDIRRVNQQQRVHISNSPERLPKQKLDYDRANSFPARQQCKSRLPHTMSENDIDHIGKH